MTDTQPENPRAVIGDNTLANLPAVLAEKYLDTTRFAANLTILARDLPETIAGDDSSRVTSDFYKEVDALRKSIDKLRVGEKEPFLEGGRKVDGFFRALVEPLDRLAESLGKRVTAYLVAKEAAERRRREEAARQAREEETRKLREAQAAQEAAAKLQASARKAAGMLADVTLDQAVNASVRADQADREADAKPADLARTRGQSSLATLRPEWTFEILDAGKIPLESLRPYIQREAIEKALRGFVKIHKDAAKLDGVRFYLDQKGMIR